MEQIRLRVDALRAGRRLDRALAELLPRCSRAQLQRLIRAGLVRVEGRPCKPSSFLREGQLVEVLLPPPEGPRLVPQELPLRVLFADEDLIVVDKPPGMAVHPGSGLREGTLVNALLARFPHLREVGPPERPGIVHRLDKDTSGLLAVAASAEAYRALVEQFKRREVVKVYLGVTVGEPDREEGEVRLPVGRHPVVRTRMAVRPEGREAITRWRVVRRLGGFCLLELHPLTGRTHQIRVHLRAVGMPLVGDPLYGRRQAAVRFPRQALHAHRLCLRHPRTDRPLCFESPLPPDMAGLLQELASGC